MDRHGAGKPVGIGREAVSNPDACLAVQAQPGPSPSHPAAAAQSDKLAGLLGRLASARQSHGLVYRRGDRGVGSGTTHDPMWTAFYSPLAILTALTLRAVFRQPYRQTEGLIGSIISLLGLTLRVPDHTNRPSHQNGWQKVPEFGRKVLAQRAVVLSQCDWQDQPVARCRTPCLRFMALTRSLHWRSTALV
jgi:Transposase DDE domain